MAEVVAQEQDTSLLEMPVGDIAYEVRNRFNAMKLLVMSEHPEMSEAEANHEVAIRCVIELVIDMASRLQDINFRLEDREES